jgi:hypothetical protein
MDQQDIKELLEAMRNRAIKDGNKYPGPDWLDWATTRFRFYQPASRYTGSNLLLRPVLSSPAHGSPYLPMAQI